LKRLYLFRHAKSSWAEAGLDDHDRPLAERGIGAAIAMGRFFADAGLSPELVLISSSERTRATYRLAAEAAWPVRPRSRILRGLYLAGAAELLRRIQGLDDRLGSVMLVGHNPGMHELAAQLAGSGSEEERRRLTRKFPTGGFASLQFKVDRWQRIAPGEGRLERFVVPRELGQSSTS
jgi:phosphohistidine phosphatase